MCRWSVLAHQSPVWKKRLGRAAFVVSTLRRWWSYSYPEIEVRHAGTSLRGTLVAVCNIPYYGGRFKMAPGAVLKPHDHPGHVVVTLGLEGSARYAHYDLADEPPSKNDRSTPFLVRETRTGILTPGCTTHLSRTRDNLHTFTAGPEGAVMVPLSLISLPEERPCLLTDVPVRRSPDDETSIGRPRSSCLEG